jgi:hypothetical protein
VRDLELHLGDVEARAVAEARCEQLAQPRQLFATPRPALRGQRREPIGEALLAGRGFRVAG